MNLFCIVVMNPDSKRFDSYCDWRIQLHRFANLDLRVRSLKIRICGFNLRHTSKLFDLFSQIQQFLMNPYKSLAHKCTLNKPKSVWILGFGFANPYCFQNICFVDSFCPTVFERCVLSYGVQKICFVDSFWKNKNPKVLNLYQFGRIRIRFPHPDHPL